MSHVIQVSREELEGRREEILRKLGITMDELRQRAETSSLVGEEWGAWQELGDIAFLLEDD